MLLVISCEMDEDPVINDEDWKVCNDVEARTTFESSSLLSESRIFSF